MAAEVKTRTYRSARRMQQANATRERIVQAARELLVERGYKATSVAAIAQRAGVSVDTLYASVGRKPQIVMAVIDALLGGSQAQQRAYVQQIAQEPTARGKIARYARAVADLVPQIAPLQEALRQAADSDPACARQWESLTQRRASNMRLFAAELRATGQVRTDLTDDEVADIVWATNASEFWVLVQQRGWTPDSYERFLRDAWCRILLEQSGLTG